MKPYFYYTLAFLLGIIVSIASFSLGLNTHGAEVYEIDKKDYLCFPLK